MSYKEKKSIVNWLFSGKDDKGKPLGIYLKRVDKKKWMVDIHAKFNYKNILWER